MERLSSQRRRYDGDAQPRAPEARPERNGRGGLMAQTMRVLTLNIGSSSLKAALYEVGPAYDDPQLVFAAHADRLGASHSRMSVQDAQGAPLFATEQGLSDHPAALQTLLGWLQQQGERD